MSMTLYEKLILTYQFLFHSHRSVHSNLLNFIWRVIINRRHATILHALELLSLLFLFSHLHQASCLIWRYLGNILYIIYICAVQYNSKLSRWLSPNLIWKSNMNYWGYTGMEFFQSEIEQMNHILFGWINNCENSLLIWILRSLFKGGDWKRVISFTGSFSKPTQPKNLKIIMKLPLDGGGF